MRVALVLVRAPVARLLRSHGERRVGGGRPDEGNPG